MTVLNQLVPRLQKAYGNTQLTIIDKDISSAGKKEVVPVKSGLLSDNKITVIGNESITMPLSKQAATGPQEKYITSKTSKILKK